MRPPCPLESKNAHHFAKKQPKILKLKLSYNKYSIYEKIYTIFNFMIYHVLNYIAAVFGWTRV